VKLGTWLSWYAAAAATLQSHSQSLPFSYVQTLFRLQYMQIDANNVL